MRLGFPQPCFWISTSPAYCSSRRVFTAFCRPQWSRSTTSQTVSYTLLTRDVVIKCCKKAGLKVEKFESRKGMRMHCVVRKPMGKAIGNELSLIHIYCISSKEEKDKIFEIFDYVIRDIVVEFTCKGLKKGSITSCLLYTSGTYIICF